MHVKPPVTVARGDAHLVAVSREDRNSQVETPAVTSHQMVVGILGSEALLKGIDMEVRARIGDGDPTGLLLVQDETQRVSTLAFG